MINLRLINAKTVLKTEELYNVNHCIKVVYNFDLNILKLMVLIKVQNKFGYNVIKGS